MAAAKARSGSRWRHEYRRRDARAHVLATRQDLEPLFQHITQQRPSTRDCPVARSLPLMGAFLVSACHGGRARGDLAAA